MFQQLSPGRAGLTPFADNFRLADHLSGTTYRMPFCMSIDGCTGRRLQVHYKAQPLLLTFRRNCVVDYGQLPSSAALYPHMSESKGKGRARRKGGGGGALCVPVVGGATP